ncbi:DUF2520 domain-containing protein [Microbacterium lacus]|uniref:Rossmann-like and DUF2520 domain-containing protein n=1 Tax=Microbacterium lacus TaxID=415217 RepID=UPI00384C1176
MTATIVGRGRVGRALAAAFEAAGITVTGPTVRGESVPDGDLILVCVPDAEIARVIATLGDHPGLVGHVSGATSLADASADFSLHPLQTFAGSEGAEAFHGIGCAVAGRTPAALEVAEELAIRIGARPFRIDDAHRAGYHAAASVASNFLLTLLDAAEQIAATAGLSDAEARELLAPLVRSTVENWAAQGAPGALTGPIARGDERTVDRQRDAIQVGAPDLLPLFDVMAESTRTLAARRGVSA